MAQDTAPPAQSAATQTQGAPRAQIEKLNDVLLEAMQRADQLGFQGRYDLLAPVLERTFDFQDMARTSAGSFWSKFSPDEQARYLEAFKRSSISTFASRFDGFSGEKLEVAGEQPGVRGSVMVQTRILPPGEEPVSISYLMRQGDAGWRVVDVYLASTYSEVAVKRSEYTSVLRQGGVDALVDALDRKVAEMKAKSSS